MKTSALFILSYLLFVATSDGAGAPPPAPNTPMEQIRVSRDGTHFMMHPSNRPFLAWGFNHDHDQAGRLLEDYWQSEWPTLQEDFREMKALGANTIRIHLQLARFMEAPTRPNTVALEQLRRLLKLAEDTGLYLDITGLGCYHKQDVPAWYDNMDENDRWRVQTLFWEAVAATCADSPAVFCYDLMNEPILPGAGKKENEWLTGELGGKHFVQRITRDLAGRTREQVAQAWVETLTTAIRKHDPHHMITVGVIPWVYTFPKAQPLFYAPDIARHLDFVSVHFYPKKGDTLQALKALKAYDIGKPLVIEEMFPLQCGLDELDAFIEGSRSFADGWIGFYWGTPPHAVDAKKMTIAEAITKAWLEYFQSKGAVIFGANATNAPPVAAD